MDVRSQPDEIPYGSYRFLENMSIDKKRRPCRINGFTKAFSERDANNWDLHDQLGTYARQPITSQFQVITPTGFSKYFACTQNRIYSLNSDTGNYRVITDQYGGVAEAGCSETKWMGAGVNSTVLFSNGSDPILAHVIDQPPEEDGSYVFSVKDLDNLGITRAKVVVAWNNIILLMNIEQDGEWRANRIAWSDFRRPLSFNVSDDSLAGYQDIDSSDRILYAAPIKGSLLVYTTNGIWEGRITGGETGIGFSRRWQSSQGKRTLAYKHTLVSTGEEHYYLGSDNIYKYSLFDQEPVIQDWTDKVAPLLLDDINKEKCNVHVGGYESNFDRIWWSVAKEGEECPSHSLIIYPDFKFSSHVDHGFTSFLFAEPDVNKTLRSVILERCICTLESLAEDEGDFVNEGGICSGETDPSCDVQPNSFFTLDPITEGTLITENWNGTPDEDSLFSIYGSVTINDLCRAEFAEDECNSERLFLMASSEDYCIKQSHDIRHREICTSFDGCGEYENHGYQSRILSPPLDLKIPDDDKVVNRFAIEHHFEVESLPGQIDLRIGIASNAVDPLDPNCAIIWEEEDKKPIGCPDPTSVSEHDDDGTRPNSEMEWGLYMEGRYLYFDIRIVNENSSPVDRGGFVCFSRFTFDAAAKPRC